MSTIFLGTRAFLAFLSIASASSQLQAAVKLDRASLTSYDSPNGITEICGGIQHIPGGAYDDEDSDKESKFCSLNFYASNSALCPKYWSTSAGIIAHQLKDEISVTDFENKMCSLKGPKADIYSKNHLKFKSTMNQDGTSATFSPSSLLYYHFSRYLNTRLEVPVSVYRTIDPATFRDRVAVRGQNFTPKQSAMNVHAWKIIIAAANNPSSYKPTQELFMKDPQDHLQIFGILIGGGGLLYDAEMNGGGSSDYPTYRDFTQTPAYTALRSEAPLNEAIETGLKSSFENVKISQAFDGKAPSKAQMVSWMQELTELVTLDYIFAQQDRLGNIEYKWEWLYKDSDGKIQHVKEKSRLPLSRAKAIKAPSEIASYHPVLIQHTQLSDNDAGGKNYANFTKKYKVVETIRHFSATTYTKLQALAKNMRNNGQLFEYLRDSFGISKDQTASIAKRVVEVADILKKACSNKSLRFDLDVDTYLKSGGLNQNGNADTIVEAKEIDCE